LSVDRVVFLENVFLLRALCVYASVCYVAVSTIVAKRLRGPSYTFFWCEGYYRGQRLCIRFKLDMVLIRLQVEALSLRQMLNL